MKINATGFGFENYNKFTPAKILYAIRKKQEENDSEFSKILSQAITDVEENKKWR